MNVINVEIWIVFTSESSISFNVVVITISTVCFYEIKMTQSWRPIKSISIVDPFWNRNYISV